MAQQAIKPRGHVTKVHERGHKVASSAFVQEGFQMRTGIYQLQQEGAGL